MFSKKRSAKKSKRRRKREKMERAKIQQTIDGKPSPSAPAPKAKKRAPAKRENQSDLSTRMLIHPKQKKFCLGPRTPSEERAWHELHREKEK